MTCRHESLLQPGKLSPPSSFSKIYKDECCLCFKTPEDPDGIYVCLSCFHGGCRDHGDLHFSKTGHCLALKIEKFKFEPSESPPKICKLEIAPEPEEQFNVVTGVHCLACQGSVDSTQLSVFNSHQLSHNFF